MTLDSPGIPAHCHRAQIAACALCDPDGYRGSTICDHQEHREAARRGMELVRAEIAKAKGERPPVGNHTGVTPLIAPEDAQPRESATGGEA